VIGHAGRACRAVEIAHVADRPQPISQGPEDVAGRRVLDGQDLVDRRAVQVAVRQLAVQRVQTSRGIA